MRALLAGRLLRYAPACLLITACGPTSNAVDAGGEPSPGTDGQDSAALPELPPDADPEDEPTPEGGESSGGDEDSPSSFVDNPDGGSVAFECDWFAQDCPEGTKCNAWANGGGAWNSLSCFPVVEDPDGVGESCTVEGSGVSGLDTCDVGAMCWDVDPETNTGTCVAMCEGDEANPICTDPATQCNGPRSFPLCLPSCCPLEQDCPEGHACYAINHDFACLPDVSGEQGGFGEPCEFVNVCDPGLLCLGAAAIVECDGWGCCTALCEVGFAGCGELQPGLECVPWYETGEAPPGLEHVGVCVVPE